LLCFYLYIFWDIAETFVENRWLFLNVYDVFTVRPAKCQLHYRVCLHIVYIDCLAPSRCALMSGGERKSRISEWSNACIYTGRKGIIGRLEWLLFINARGASYQFSWKLLGSNLRWQGYLETGNEWTCHVQAPISVVIRPTLSVIDCVTLCQSRLVWR